MEWPQVLGQLGQFFAKTTHVFLLNRHRKPVAPSAPRCHGNSAGWGQRDGELYQRDGAHHWHGLYVFGALAKREIYVAAMWSCGSHVIENEHDWKWHEVSWTNVAIRGKNRVSFLGQCRTYWGPQDHQDGGFHGKLTAEPCSLFLLEGLMYREGKGRWTKNWAVRKPTHFSVVDAARCHFWAEETLAASSPASSFVLCRNFSVGDMKAKFAITDQDSLWLRPHGVSKCRQKELAKGNVQPSLARANVFQ